MDTRSNERDMRWKRRENNAMTIATRYFFVVSMDVDPDKEDLFNEVYDSEHVPYLTAVPGVLGATRSVRRPLRMMLAGAEREMDSGTEPRYSVIYEIESPDVLLSAAWAMMPQPRRVGANALLRQSE